MGESFADSQAELVTVEPLDFAQEFVACAIQHRYAVSTADAQDMPGMVRLAAGQEQVWFPALLRRQEETVHGEKSGLVLEQWD
jgi:hypothetical protein